MLYDIENLPQRIYIGADNSFGQHVFEFDVSEWIARWPTATFAVFINRPYETRQQAYPVGGAERTGNILRWTVGASDTQKIGDGFAEIHAVVGSEVLAKSTRMIVSISESVCDDGAEPPEPFEGYVARIEAAAASASASAAAAAASAASFTIDPTLSHSGQSADAGATGNALARKADKINVDAHDSRITNLEYALNGYAFREQEDDDDAYTKVVPASAMPYAELENVGGRTVVWNRSPQTVRSNDQSITGITYTRLDDNTCRVHGTNTGTGGAWPVIFAHTVPPSGHKCYFFGLHALTEFAFTNGGFYWQPFGYFPLTASDCILTSNGTNVGNAYLVVPVGETLDVTIHPQFVDLTQMFGAGYEPTLEECRQIFAAGTYAYSTPTIKHAGVTKVVTTGINVFPPSTRENGTLNGVAFAQEASGIWKANGTASQSVNYLLHSWDPVEIMSGHKLLIKLPDNASTTTVHVEVAFHNAVDTLITDEHFTGTDFAIYTMPDTATEIYYGLRVYQGYTCSNTAFYPVIIDLTRIYGAGNEPTLEECRQIFTERMYTPRTPITYAIPAAVQALDGYGWSAGDVSNSIEWDGEKWWYVKRVGRQHMSEIYLRIETYNSHVRCSGTIGDMLDNTTNLMSNKYISNRVVFSQNNVDLVVGAYSSHTIYLRDDSLEGGTSGRQPSLDDVYLFYELATPVRTDITSLMNMDGYINVEAGGTVTFEHAMGTTDSIRVPVPNKETFLIKLPGGGA